MPLTGYGLREWLTITIICAVLAGVLWWLVGWWTTPLVVVGWLALVSFFRDPIRRVPTDLPPGTMLAPADGMISAVLQVNEHEATDGRPAVIIRILLTVLNVHVNRSPCDGVVTALRYQPGQFVNALNPQSADVNEFNLITMETSDGEHIGVKQIAGKVARRIVCPLNIGDRLRRGQKFGMIKFGSTTELILPRPDDVTVLVEVGDKVRGGLTSLAILPPVELAHQPVTAAAEASGQGSRH